MIDCYLNFCRAIFTRYKGKVKYWLTFNEINSATTAMGAFLGQGILNEIKEMEFMDQVDVPQNRFQGLHHQFIASALAVKWHMKLIQTIKQDVCKSWPQVMALHVIQMIKLKINKKII